MYLFLSSIATAATLSVGPGQAYLDLPLALADASSGDTIELAPGTYEGGEVPVDVTLVGLGAGPTETIITGGYYTLELSEVTVVVDNLTLDGGGTQRVIQLEDGDLELYNTVIRNGGGDIPAILATYSRLWMEGSTVEQHQAYHGFQVISARTSQVTSMNNTFRDNTANYAIEIDYQDSTFLSDGDTFLDTGAVIVRSSDDVIIRNGTIENPFHTGLAATSDAVVQVTHMDFINAPISLDNEDFSTLIVSQSRFLDGASLGRVSGDFSFTNNLVCNNDASDTFMLVVAWAQLHITNNLFVANHRTNRPLIGISAGYGEIANNTFVGNTSDETDLSGINATLTGQYPASNATYSTGPVCYGHQLVHSNIFAYNTAAPIRDDYGQMDSQYNLGYSTGTGGDHATSSVDPGFANYPGQDPCDVNNYLPASATSGMVDAGHPDLFDVNGSRADAGAFGGPAAELQNWADNYTPTDVPEAPDQPEATDAPSDDKQSNTSTCASGCNSTGGLGLWLVALGLLPWRRHEPRPTN